MMPWVPSSSAGRLGRGALCLLIAATASCGPVPGRGAPIPPPEAAAASGPGCTSDTECKGARVCQAGQCVSPALDPETVAQIEGGSVGFHVLDQVLASRRCHELPGLGPRLAELASSGEARDQAATAFGVELAGSDPRFADGPAAYGAWVMRVREHAVLCKRRLDNEQIARLTKGVEARVGEADVEKAMAANDCGALTAIDAGDLWPFRHQFSMEVIERKFGEAEVTRRLWVKMLGKYKDECVKRLTERQKIAVDAQVDKLERIVGLDDNILIDLRSKLLDAIEQDDASAVLAYSRAVTEREAQIDGRNAAAYKAKLETMQAELKARREELASTRAATQAAANAGPAQAQPSALQGATTTMQDVNAAANTTVQTVQTIQTVGSLFGF